MNEREQELFLFLNRKIDENWGSLGRFLFSQLLARFSKEVFQQFFGSVFTDHSALLSKSQSSCPKHSTLTALIKVCDDWLKIWIMIK